MTVRRSLAVGLLLCAAAAVAVLAARWTSEADEFDRAGARAFTREALERAGLERVEVAGAVRATRYRPRTFAPDDPPLEVFRTTARARGGTVELLVHAPSGRAVYLRDVADDGGPLLTDAQYRRLRSFTWHDEADAADRRRLAGTASAILLGVVAVATAELVRRGKMEP